MYEDTEDSSDIDEEFFSALALLHSSAEDSAEKLRKMLDATIERRYGFEKTLAARMPKRFLQTPKPRGKTAPSEKTEALPRETEKDLTKQTGNVTPVACNAAEVDWKPMETSNVDVEDYSDNGDIPRISIPDEGSGDGLLCKVCNGAKLGPLILLECQDCQEVYHPLCHQPPVVDIDVYDPRIVWRCKKCTDSASVNSVAEAPDERKVKRHRRPSDASKAKEAAPSKVDASKFSGKKLNGNLSKSKATPADQTSSDACQKPVHGAEETSITKGSFCPTQKNTRTASSSQLRKRIGSKLSVKRSVAK